MFTKSVKTLIFGGTFDPVHIGHLFIAETACSQLGYQRVLFIPSLRNPLKHNPIASTVHRYRMLSLAIKGSSKFTLSDIELRNKKISFSVETVKELYKKDLKAKAGFLIGSDVLLKRNEWKDFSTLASLVDIVVAEREENITHNYQHLYTKVPMISSRYIRELLQKKYSVRYLVPELVHRYILKYSLYG